jgi:alkanesulfonate monooxygenase
LTVEFIGLLTAREYSEIVPPTGEPINCAYIRLIAQTHERSGFDRVYLAQNSIAPDSFMIASYAASATKRLQFLLAHRPGFMTPTLAARKLATLDHVSGGRLAVGIVTGGDDSELQRDGDFLTKEERYKRTDEYLEIVRRIWSQDRPFDHQGSFYRFKSAYSEAKPLQKPCIPIYFSGASEAAIAIAAKHADVYASWGEPLAEMREVVARLRVEAAKHNRTLRFSISFRPILAETEERAWSRAATIRERTIEARERSGLKTSGHIPSSAGSQRQLNAAANGERLDKVLWTGIAAVNGGAGSSIALVGTADQVADTLLEYYRIGVTTFLLRGFNPLDDAMDFGKRLIPLTRRLVAEHDARHNQ